MSFLAPKQKTPAQSATRQPYDHGGAVPAVFGRARVPLRLIESPFNRKEHGHGQTRPTGISYSLALAACHGPVDRLYAIYMGGYMIWSLSGYRGDESNPGGQPGSPNWSEYQAGSHYGDGRDRGGSGGGPDYQNRMRVYWGTQEQSPDPFLNGTDRSYPHALNPGRIITERALQGHPHPAYRGICYVVFYGLHLDDGEAEVRGNASIPQLEAEVFVTPPGAPDLKKWTVSGSSDGAANAEYYLIVPFDPPTDHAAVIRQLAVPGYRLVWADPVWQLRSPADAPLSTGSGGHRWDPASATAWTGGVSVTVDNRRYYGANPVRITRALLSNPVWGASVPESALPAAEWEDAAARMLAPDGGYGGLRGERTGLSPVFADTQPLDRQLADFLAVWGGFLRVRGGQILPDWFPARNAPLPDPMTEITRHDMTAEPDIDAGTWEDVVTEVEVESRDVFERLETGKDTARSSFARDAAGTDRRHTLGADPVISRHARRELAERELSRLSRPKLTARVRILRGRARHPEGSPYGGGALIMPGDLVRLNYEPLDLQIVCRVIEREDTPDGPRLFLENDRGRLPEDFIAPVDERDLPQDQDPEAPPHVRTWELPPALAGTAWPPRVAVLATRAHRGIAGAEVWISDDSQFAGEEQRLAVLRAWGTRATLNASLPASGITSVMEFTIDGESEIGLDRSFSAAEELDGHMLVLAGAGEVMSLGSIVSGDAPPQRKYIVRRAMYGTAIEFHGWGSEVWILRRDRLEEMTYDHAIMRWAAPWSVSAQVWMRLAAFTPFAVADPSPPVGLLMQNTLYTPAMVLRPWQPFGLRMFFNWATAPREWINTLEYAVEYRKLLPDGSWGDWIRLDVPRYLRSIEIEGIDPTDWEARLRAERDGIPDNWGPIMRAATVAMPTPGNVRWLLTADWLRVWWDPIGDDETEMEAVFASVGHPFETLSALATAGVMEWYYTYYSTVDIEGTDWDLYFRYGSSESDKIRITIPTGGAAN